MEFFLLAACVRRRGISLPETRQLIGNRQYLFGETELVAKRLRETAEEVREVPVSFLRDRSNSEATCSITSNVAGGYLSSAVAKITSQSHKSIAHLFACYRYVADL